MVDKTETKSQKFMRICMDKTWSVPFHVKKVIQYRRSWLEGYTSKELLKRVKDSLKENYPNKSKRLKLDSIYGAVSKINLLHFPPFVIACEGRLFDSDKLEYRYYVPYTPGDLQKTKGKQIRQINRKKKVLENTEKFEEEQEKEQEKEKIFAKQEEKVIEVTV